MISLLDEGQQVGSVFFCVINIFFFELFASQSDLVLVFHAFKLLC